MNIEQLNKLVSHGESHHVEFKKSTGQLKSAFESSRMIGYCQSNKTPEPEFVQYKSGFAVVFKFKEAMHTAVTSTVSI